MAQRDYEDQPEAPDLGASVQLESEQHLAAPAGDRDGLDAGYVPPDRPYALDEDGVTARGMQEGDSLDERLHRERGEETPDPDRSGRVTMAGEGAALETPDALDGVDVGIDGGAASAEEAAVHEVDGRSPVGGGGAPVEVEPSMADAAGLRDPEVEESLDEDPLADRARAAAAADARADDDLREPGPPPVAEGSEPRATAPDGNGGGLDGREPDPALPRDPADRDPADRIDSAREAGGAAAPASGREDVGPGSGL